MGKTVTFTENTTGPERFDCIVVGSGGMGSATAYHLAKDGRKVLLLEQFEIGHARGSSHGESRVIRYTHDEVDYARQIPATFDLWHQLEQESGKQLLRMTGGIFMAPAGGAYHTGVKSALTELGFDFAMLDATQMPARYPQFSMPGGWQGLFQEQTGVLAASLCVQTMAGEAVRHGATLRERTRVTAIRPQSGSKRPGVEVAASSEGVDTVWHADKLFLCVGPWAPAFLESLLPVPIPLRVTHQQVAYYPARDLSTHRLGRFPVFLFAGQDTVYGMPSWERKGCIKVSMEQEQLTRNPEDEDRSIDNPLLERLNAFVAKRLPGVHPEPVHAESCLYTETASKDFIIDRHPDHPRIHIAAGFSGKGFKHTIAVGRLLADLCASEPGEYPSEFWLDRYRLALK